MKHAPRWYDNAAVPQPRVSMSMMRRPAPVRTLPAGPRASVAAARETVHQQAERSRAEIKALVEAERTEVAALVEDSVKGTEERLRGATENRVDTELARIHEAEEKMLAEIAESVKAEVARTIAKLRSKREPEPSSRAKSSNGAKASNGSGKASNGSGKASSRKTKSSSSGSRKAKSTA